LAVLRLSDSARVQAARELLETARLQGAELVTHLKNARSREYWKALAPSLSLCGDPTPALMSETVAVDAIERADLISHFGREGYLQTPPLFPAPVIDRMQAGVMKVIAADWPPAFAFVYDEFWLAPRVPLLTDLFSAFVGEGFRQTPYVWTHVVAGHRGAAGWPPHVDNHGDVFRLTVWIPLTDATVESGCMTLIPKDRMPRSDEGQWHARPGLDMNEVLSLLHATRPLPVRAGAVLGWDARLMHWGSARQASGDPRISISMELVPATAPADVLDEALCVSGARLPTMEERLRIVARAISLYGARENGVWRYTGLADRLLEELGDA
jgi:hypothetical protein